MATWRRCSSCKSELHFEATYWVCSVSTCNRKRTGLFFCSVACWEAHLPTMRHREAWAVEKRAPNAVTWERQQAQEADESRDARGAPPPASAESPKRRVVAAPAELRDDALPRDVLIVVTKLKKYIKARSGMNTSENVLPVLSEFVRSICDRAIRRAAEDGRKTVMDRDFRGLF